MARVPPPNSSLEAAIRLARQGWPVLPLKGKIPATKHGCHDATTDEAQLRATFTDEHNIGVATGEASGLIVLDLDVKGGKNGFDSLAQLETEHGPLPATLTAKTGSGGMHMYYKLPADVTIGNSAGKLGPGIDVRGQGGYVVAPPSIHPETGVRYEWSSDPATTPIAEAPAWLIERLHVPMQPSISAVVPMEVSDRAKQYGLKVLAERARELASTTDGERNHRLNQAAFRIGQLSAACGIPFATACSELLAAATDIGLPDKESLATFQSGWSGGLRNPVVPDLSGEPLAKPVQPRRNAECDVECSPPRPPLVAISAAELSRMQFPPPRWVVPDLLCEGLCVFAGRPKMGKSWFALALTVAVATGGYVLGSIRVEKGKALYAALEDNERRLQRRLAQLLGGAEAPEDLFLTCALPRLDDGGLEVISGFLDEHPDCKVIIIDTLARCRPPARSGANSYDHDSYFLGHIQSFALRRGVAIVVVTHLRKEISTDVFDAVTGSVGITGAADCVWVLNRSRGEADGTLMVTGRDVQERELALQFDSMSGHWSLLGEGKQFTVSPARREILELLDRSEHPLGPKEIAEALGRESTNIRFLLTKLVEVGDVERVERGKYRLPRSANIAHFANNGTPHNLEPALFDLEGPFVSDVRAVSGDGCYWEDDA